MIFGMTNDERNERWQLYLKRLWESGTEHFAWRPKKLADGRWIWLQKYYRHYHVRRHEYITKKGKYWYEFDSYAYGPHGEKFSVHETSFHRGEQ